MERSRVMILVVLAIALTACGGPQSTVKEVSLDAQDITFSADTLEVTAGQPVKLTLNNTGALEHDFSIIEIPLAKSAEQSDPMGGHDMSGLAVEPELHVAASPGDSATIEFTPTKAGTYEFFCTTAGHKEAGMIGTLVVKEP